MAIHTTDVTRTTTAKTFIKSRTGLRTTIQERIDTQFVADRVLTSALISTMRARPVAFIGERMRPNIRVYPFFDSVDVSAYCMPSRKITFSSYTGAARFDYTTPVGAGADSTHRSDLASSTPIQAGMRGDIIFLKTSGASTYTVDTSPWKAIVVFADDDSKTVHVVLEQGDSSLVVAGEDLEAERLSSLDHFVEHTTVLHCATE